MSEQDTGVLAWIRSLGHPSRKDREEDTSEWQYKGSTSNPEKHTWTNGTETVEIRWRMFTRPPGFEAIVPEREDSEATLILSNGLSPSLRDPLILADLYMRDDKQDPMMQMDSERAGREGKVRSVGDGRVTLSGVPQERWLSLHRHDYEFKEIDPEDVNE